MRSESFSHRHLHVFIRVVLVILGVSVSAATQVPEPFASAVSAHGGAAVAAIRWIRLSAQSSRGGTRQALTVSAAMDGRLRLDYGRPATRSVVSTDAPFEVIAGEKILKPPHTGAFAELDILSVFAVGPYIAVPKTFLGTAAYSGGTMNRYEAITSRRQTPIPFT